MSAWSQGCRWYLDIVYIYLYASPCIFEYNLQVWTSSKYIEFLSLLQEQRTVILYHLLYVKDETIEGSAVIYNVL